MTKQEEKNMTKLNKNQIVTNRISLNCDKTQKLKQF